MMHKRAPFLIFICCAATALAVLAQEAVRPADRPSQPVPKAQSPAAPPPQVAGTVQVDFPGATALDLKDLKAAIAEQIKEIEDKGLTNARADDAAFFLAQYYRAHGYAKAEVVWQIADAHHLVLKVSEGPVTTLRKITFSGNRQMPDDTLSDYLLGPTKERFPDQQDNFPYVESDVQTGLEKLRGLYAAQGFLKATVLVPELGTPPVSSHVDLTVQIVEGTKYVWGAVTFNGETAFTRAELLAVTGDLNAKPFTPDEVVKMQRDLQYFYKSHGYFEAKVTAAADPETAIAGSVPVTFTLDPGRIFLFGGVTVKGLVRLDPAFLPNRFHNLQGQPYSPEKTQSKFRDLMKTGLFKTLHMNEVPLPSGEVRLDLTAEEAKSHELGFALGFSTFEGGIADVTWKDRDVFGEGRPLNIEAKVSQRGLLGDINYTDPWFIDDKLTEKLRLYGTTRMFNGYDKLENGFRAEFAHKFADKLEVSAFAQMRQLQVSNISFAPLPADDLRISQLPLDQQAAARAAAVAAVVGPTHYPVASLGLTQSLDLRDSPLNPTKGLHLTSSAELASDVLGKGVEFIRVTAAAAYFYPLGKGVLAVGARAGVIDSLGGGDVPVDERFFNGGARSVRSFVERGMGPADKNGVPIGGDSFTVFNLEYTHPLYRGLELAGFFDAGSVGTSSGFGTLSEAVGLGLRYKTPVGPLRLDYGVNPSQRGRESPGAFFVSIGAAF